MSHDLNFTNHTLSLYDGSYKGRQAFVAHEELDLYYGVGGERILAYRWSVWLAIEASMIEMIAVFISGIFVRVHQMPVNLERYP
jgi:hypothetical protein